MWVSPRDSFINNATLERPNTIGVHSNDWSILLGYYNTKTKRVMGCRGFSSHIYDVSESYIVHHTERYTIPWFTEYQGNEDHKRVPHVHVTCRIRSDQRPVMFRYKRSGYGLEPLVVVLISHEYHNQMTLFITQSTNDIRTINERKRRAT